MIKFSAARLEKEPIELSGEEGPEFLALEDDPVFSTGKKVRYALRVVRVSGGAVVTGTAATKVKAVCGRCLKPIEIPLAAEDIKIYRDLAECGDEVDISEDVRDELLLNLPQNPLCSPNCRGLCPHCGTDLNDGECDCQNTSGSPAWAALDRLKFEKEVKS